MTPVRDGIVVAPADGRVSQIVNAVPPQELDLGERPLPRISIFMSVFDCHVNRSPVAGRIERIVYRAGKFFSADLDKASEDNERNALLIATADGQRIAVIQIAGLVARRIVSFTREGESVGAGHRIGMIRFGSRVDVYLPEGTRPLAAEGQTAIAGETVLADSRRPRRADISRDLRTLTQEPVAPRGGRLPETAYCGHERMKLASHHPVSGPAAAAFPPHPRAHAGAKFHHAARAVRGLTAIRMAFENRYVLALGGHRLGRNPRRHRRPPGALPQGTSRFGAELDSLVRLRQFRRRAGADHLFLGPA